ncbi:MAG: hypothetical protein JWR50_1627, partial [Mucilaginibacter sp.]|nr:hypothetical protein [Mucilaginibacter sp.]
TMDYGLSAMDLTHTGITGFTRSKKTPFPGIRLNTGSKKGRLSGITSFTRSNNHRLSGIRDDPRVMFFA